MSQWLVWLAAQLLLLISGPLGYQRQDIPTPDGSLSAFSAAGQGSLPPVLLLHGIGSQALDLLPLAERLRPHVQKVILVDLPAHGWSQVPVERLDNAQIQQNFYSGMDQLLAQEAPVMLVGNSLGGWQALRYAYFHPQELSSLVLISPAGAHLDEAQYHDLRRVFAEDSTQHPERLVDLLYNEPPAYRDLAAQFLRERFAAPPVQAYLNQLGPTLFLQPSELQHLAMPTLLIWGQQDKVFPGQLAFFKQNLPPQCRIVEPAHFTHSPYIEGQMEAELGNLLLEWSQEQATGLQDTP